MSHQGAPPNISQHPALRKVESRVQSIEKHLKDESKRISDAEEKVQQLETQVVTLEAKVAALVRTIRELQRSTDATPAMHFVDPPAKPAAPKMAAAEEAVEVRSTRPVAASDSLSIQRIDTVLSHLGIRLVTVQANECQLEAMNRYGQENLDRLHGDFSLGTVEDFVRARQDLA